MNPPLSDIERKRFKRAFKEAKGLEEFIESEKSRAEIAGLSRNMDGELSRRSKLGSEVRKNIETSEVELDKYESFVCSLANKSCGLWHELNEKLKACLLMRMALFGWLIGAGFFYARYKACGDVTLWLELFIPAICAGIGALIGKCISRNPAENYAPEPAYIDMDNVDAPKIVRPMLNKSQTWEVAVNAVWSVLFMIALQKGHEVGLTELAANVSKDLAQKNLDKARSELPSKRIDVNSVAPQFALPKQKLPTPNTNNIQREKMIQGQSDSAKEEKINKTPILFKNFTFGDMLPPSTINELNLESVQMLILAIYAHHGAEFESPSNQKWADQQTWYSRVQGRRIRDAKEFFTKIDYYNLEQLVTKRNDLQSQKAIPAEENISNTHRVITEIKEESAKGNLDPNDIDYWDLLRVRSEINMIYARYGIVFPNKDLQLLMSRQPWYKSVPGRTFDEAEKLFSAAERKDIELLAARREHLLRKPTALKALPVTE